MIVNPMIIELLTALEIQNQICSRVILVTKDINMRLKALSAGLNRLRIIAETSW